MIGHLELTGSVTPFCCFQRETEVLSRAEEEKTASHQEDQHLHRLLHRLLRPVCRDKVSSDPVPTHKWFNLLQKLLCNELQILMRPLITRLGYLDLLRVKWKKKKEEKQNLVFCFPTHQLRRFLLQMWPSCLNKHKGFSTFVPDTLKLLGLITCVQNTEINPTKI